MEWLNDENPIGTLIGYFNWRLGGESGVANNSNASTLPGLMTV
jgi:hypothetical protein